MGGSYDNIYINKEKKKKKNLFIIGREDEEKKYLSDLHFLHVFLIL